MATRPELHLQPLIAGLNRNAAGLCIDTNVELHHRGETFNIRYWWNQAPQPKQFRTIAPVTIGGGRRRVATFAYSHNSYDDSVAASHLSSINGTFNYAINGDVAIGAKGVVVTLHATLYVEFNAHTAGNRSTAVAGNQLDLTQITTYAVALQGSPAKLVVTESSSHVGGVQDLAYHKVFMGSLDPGVIRDVAMPCATTMSARVMGAASNLANTLTT